MAPKTGYFQKPPLNNHNPKDRAMAHTQAHFEAFISQIDPPIMVDPKDYRSFSGMEKTRGEFSIQLYYGYDSSNNPKPSNVIECESMEELTFVMQMLHENKITTKKKAKSVFSSLKEI